MHKNIFLYSKRQHEDQLKKWYKGWNLPDNSYLMSDLGLIVPDVAAIFLFTTNSKMCLLDGLICNPKSDKQERDECINKMIEVMIHQAKELGFKYIMGTTQFPHVLERAKQHGFQTMDKQYSAFVRSI